MRRLIDWLIGGTQPVSDERNKRLEAEVVEMEKKAGLLEKKAELQKRLDAARLRCRGTKPSGGFWSSGIIKWSLIVFVVILVLFGVVWGC